MLTKFRYKKKKKKGKETGNADGNGKGLQAIQSGRPHTERKQEQKGQPNTSGLEDGKDERTNKHERVQWGYMAV